MLCGQACEAELLERNQDTLFIFPNICDRRFEATIATYCGKEHAASQVARTCYPTNQLTVRSLAIGLVDHRGFDRRWARGALANLNARPGCSEITLRHAAFDILERSGHRIYPCGLLFGLWQLGLAADYRAIHGICLRLLDDMD